MHPCERDTDDRDSEQDGRDQMAERQPPACQHKPDDVAEQSEWPGADVVAAEMLGARIRALAESDRIEGAGDLRKWRYSEVRLQD